MEKSAVTRPSDRAIAQAFWELSANEPDGAEVIGIGVQYLVTRARELDATAAPVVVGEDMVERAIKEYHLQGHYGTSKLADVMRAVLSAALAGD